MSSPARKRLRLSSPTYDAELEELDATDLEELNRIELSLSQQQRQPVASSSSQRAPQSSQAISPNARQRRLKAIMNALQESDDKSASDAMEDKRPIEGGSSIRKVPTISRRSSHTHDEYGSGSSSSPSKLQPGQLNSERSETSRDADVPLPGFQAASKSLNLSSDDLLGSDANSGVQDFSAIGFSTAANITEKVLKPSKAALERAEKEYKDWSVEDEDWVKTVVSSSASLKRASATEVARPPLASLSNSPSVHPIRSPQPRSFSTPLLNRTAAYKLKGFKSPLLSSRGGSGRPSPTKTSAGTTRIAGPHPLVEFETPDRHSRAISDSSLQFTTPIRPTARDAVNSIKRRPRPAFSTPFKKGMKPGEPGRAALQSVQQTKKDVRTSRDRAAVPSKVTKNGKMSLKDSGLRPQRHTSEELEDMGLNIAELSQITPQTAPFYVFYTPASRALSSQTASSSGTSLGPTEALADLQRTGRETTCEWVDNHWSLILWKLAGLAALDPACESTPSRRWCWRAVLEQLEARHDKEFGKGMRPALRLITTGDAPAGSPLVLVVTAILSTEEQRIGKNGKVVQGSSAEIEVSDGWYRLRAQLDAPLARAVIKGNIKPGRKIAVSGAKLDNGRKDPCEILEAYNCCTLLLSGNGAHLAPWHAKLGFQSEPFIATLGSLTHDGGPVPLVDFTVEKVHPIAFFEFLPGDKPGEKKREGPRGEAEEAAVEDARRKRREAAESKVRDELGIRWGRWDGFAERLERAAGTKFKPSSDDMPPDHIEDLFDELDDLPPAEVGPFISQLGADECGWLARYLRRRSERDREHAAEEIELEVNHVCPPREVRNFRIVQVRDAQTLRRPANRIAHLCIWDVLSLCVSEGGKAGAIEPGQRYLMTSLVPMQQSCWMGREKDDMVYLSTTRNSRFYRLK